MNVAWLILIVPVTLALGIFIGFVVGDLYTSTEGY